MNNFNPAFCDASQGNPGELSSAPEREDGSDGFAESSFGVFAETVGTIGAGVFSAMVAGLAGGGFNRGQLA